MQPPELWPSQLCPSRGTNSTPLLPPQWRPEIEKSLLISFFSLLTGHLQPHSESFPCCLLTLFHFSPLQWPPPPVPAITILCLRRHTGYPTGLRASLAPTIPSPCSSSWRDFFFFLFPRNKHQTTRHCSKILICFLSKFKIPTTDDKALKK